MDIRVLITGYAGFIGSALTKRILRSMPNVSIVGVDNMNDYYDPKLKSYRLKSIQSLDDSRKTTFYEGDISDRAFVDWVFSRHDFDVVINLAAQAGVRYSITNPKAYIDSNLVGFFNIIDACRTHNIDKFVYASSSSVYGDNITLPYSEEDKVDHPVSLYAATKKSNELIAYSYSKLYGINTTGLRFFTVYGPEGRPDMAYYTFTQKMIDGEKVQLYNNGNCSRDFTYIDDVVDCIVKIAFGKKVDDDANYHIYNIGCSNPVKLYDFVSEIHNTLKASCLIAQDSSVEDYIELLPMQPGDVVDTFADTTALEEDYGFKPTTTLREGIQEFVKWYKTYNKD